MRTDKTDIWGDEIFIGDRIRVGSKQYVVRYGNFKYLGTDRIGLFAEDITNCNDITPLVFLKSFIKITSLDGQEVHN